MRGLVKKTPVATAQDLIFLSMDANWQQNAFLTRHSPPAPPTCERDELPTPEIIPSLARRIIKAFKNLVGNSKVLFHIYLFIYYAPFLRCRSHRHHRACVLCLSIPSSSPDQQNKISCSHETLLQGNPGSCDTTTSASPGLSMSMTLNCLIQFIKVSNLHT